MKQLESLQVRIGMWSNKKFGDLTGRKLALALHLEEEADEVKAAVVDHDRHDVKFQLADCLIIMLDLAYKFDITTDELIKAVHDKMDINKKREWDGPDENGLFHHIK